MSIGQFLGTFFAIRNREKSPIAVRTGPPHVGIRLISINRFKEDSVADKRVTKSGKNDQGDITFLCGAWGNVSKTVAITEIENKTNRYYVEEETPAVDVVVISGITGKILRTTADRTSKNNLDNLPNC
jgi:hypothetical protein